ncbi:N-6 DNA methylase [Roseobacter sp. EG26]|uniref:N-6 DNA methylase n=1 Tax=Roseobacter sp. EG26 TaxID=3412477 RepID=UPI003CE4DE8F
MFYGQRNLIRRGQGIPVCILVLKKCKQPEDVLFINASERCGKGKKQNYLRQDENTDDIEEILSTYRDRPEKIDRYARSVSMDEIEKNGYNLNISRYVSTAKPEKKIDLAEVHKRLVSSSTKAREARDRHNKFLDELGLPRLPD